MAKVIFGNHSSVIVPRKDRDNIRKFYCDVLGGKIMKEEDERDFLHLGKNFTATIEVAKSPQHVFNCITDVTNWWSKDFEGSSSKLNDEFIIHHPNQHYSKQKLIEVPPDKKIVWLVTDSTLYWLEKNKQE